MDSTEKTLLSLAYKKKMNWVITNTIKYDPQQDFLNTRFLIREIYSKSHTVKFSTIDLILTQISDSHKKLYKFQNKMDFTLLVIGRYKRKYHILETLSSTLANFYLEMEYFPNIFVLSQNDFISKHFDPFYKRSICIYDRNRNLSRII
jgi:hypothetical protein